MRTMTEEKVVIVRDKGEDEAYQKENAKGDPSREVHPILLFVGLLGHVFHYFIIDESPKTREMK